MRKLLMTIFVVLTTATAFAQKTVKDVLMIMPDSIIQYLNAEQRAELCKFSNAKDSLKVKNSLNGETYIDSISGDYAQIILNKTSRMQIKLLTLNDSAQVICTIKTISKPVDDSRIKFYSTDWKELHDTFGLPNQNDEKEMLNLLTSRPDTMDESRYNTLKSKIEPVITSATFTDDKPAITYTLSLPMFNEQERSELKAIITRKSFTLNSH